MEAYLAESAVAKRPAKKRPIPQDDADDCSVASERSMNELESKGKDLNETQRLRREKRLAMNRESARARRKRKKILIETLEKQVADLTTSNNKYRHRVEDLEKELGTAKQTIALLSAKCQGQADNLGARQPDPLTSSDPRITQASVADTLAGRLGVKSTNDTLHQLGIAGQRNPLAGALTAGAGGSNPVALAQASLLDFAGSTPSQSTLLQTLGLPAVGGNNLDDALAQHRLLFLQQQQLGVMNQPNISLPTTENTASRAVLLRQLLEQQGRPKSST